MLRVVHDREGALVPTSKLKERPKYSRALLSGNLRGPRYDVRITGGTEQFQFQEMLSSTEQDDSSARYIVEGE